MRRAANQRELIAGLAYAPLRVGEPPLREWDDLARGAPPAADARLESLAAGRVAAADDAGRGVCRRFGTKRHKAQGVSSQRLDPMSARAVVL